MAKTMISDLDPQKVQELPLGTNPDELRFNPGVREVYVPFKGKRWRFLFRESVSFAERNAILSKARATDKETGMDYNGFLIEVALILIKEAPFPVNKLQMSSLDPEFADLIYIHLPIAKLLEEDSLPPIDRKNSDGVSKENLSKTDISEH